MKFFTIAALAALTVVSAGCCRTKCAPVAQACAPAFQPQQQQMMPPPPMQQYPTLEK